MLFAPRTAYIYHYHSNDEGAYTRFAGDNPPNGAIIDFYQSSAQDSPPQVQIIDASGKVIRTIKGTHKVKDKDVPNVPNKAGINRFVWDFHEDGPTQWMGAAKESYRGPKTGPVVVPGTYVVRLTLGRETLSQNVVVKPDPRDSWTQADYQAAYDFAKKYATRYGKIDEVLNNLDAIKKSLASAADASKSNASLTSQIAAAQTRRDAIFYAFTADYHNDEDSIQRPGALREDVPRTGFGAAQPPTAETLRYASEFDGMYDAAFSKYNAFVASLGSLSKQLPKPIDGAMAVTP
jgi:hypothetical protein